MTNATIETLLTAAEVAQRCGVHKQTVFRWAWRGAIPSLKVGGARRFPADTVQQLIALGANRDQQEPAR